MRSPPRSRSTGADNAITRTVPSPASLSLSERRWWPRLLPGEGTIAKDRPWRASCFFGTVTVHRTPFLSLSERMTGSLAGRTPFDTRPSASASLMRSRPRPPVRWSTTARGASTVGDAMRIALCVVPPITVALQASSSER